MATDFAQVGAWLRLEAIQALLAIGAYPAVERATRILTLTAIGVLVELARQLARQPAALGWTEPRTRGFGNYADPRIMPIRHAFSGRASFR